MSMSHCITKVFINKGDNATFVLPKKFDVRIEHPCVTLLLHTTYPLKGVRSCDDTLLPGIRLSSCATNEKHDK
jgi:hypothetical protein